MGINLLKAAFSGQEHATGFFHAACFLFSFHLGKRRPVRDARLAIHHLYLGGRDLIENLRDLRVQLVFCFHSGSSLIESASRRPSKTRSMSWSEIGRAAHTPSTPVRLKALSVSSPMFAAWLSSHVNDDTLTSSGCIVATRLF